MVLDGMILIEDINLVELLNLLNGYIYILL